ncbi:MAG: hypothetical protein ACJ8GW_05945 [Massilia sp.]
MDYITIPLNLTCRSIAQLRAAASCRALFAALWLLPLSAKAGLDITAYEKLAIVGSPQLDKYGDPVARNQVRLKPVEYPERFAGLVAGSVYQYRLSFEFRAGSYSGYNYWRNELAKLAGYETTPVKSRDGTVVLRYDATAWDLQRGPFWELIDFSDSEGVIGPTVCKRVHKDFLSFAALAARHPDESFRSSYGEWTKAFAMCANSGAIVFH